MTESAELASELELVVRAVPGVVAVYPSAPLVATIVGAVVDALTRCTASPAMVTVTTGKTGVSVSASIGVADSDSASGVCRLVYDAIAGSPAIQPFVPINTITVTVASIG